MFIERLLEILDERITVVIYLNCAGKTKIVPIVPFSKIPQKKIQSHMNILEIIR